MTDMKTCPRCGAPRSGTGNEAEGEPASPGGLCPACLMKMGFDSRSGVVITGPEAAPRPPPPAVEDLRAHFPQLEILEHIGQGGMGAVYKARQRSLERDVALKVLTIDTSADPSFAERFEREARTLASLSHPGIVSVIDSGRAGPWFYFVMEFVDGASLRQMLRAREISPREALSIVGQLCDALQYAHDHGVVHRDIKPENVLVTRKGQVKILDFGLAKLMGDKVSRENLTSAQQVMGTPHYMAPEQWEKPKTVDHRADIYALGVVFYELLTGELPLGRFPLPSHKVQIDVRLDDVVVKTLEKEPERRYQQASEVKTAVEGIATSPAGLPRQPIRDVRGSSPGRWLLWSSLGCAALLLVPFLLAVVLFMSSHESQPNRMGAVAVGPDGQSRVGKNVLIPPAAGDSNPSNPPTWFVPHETAAEQELLKSYGLDTGLQDLQIDSALAGRLGIRADLRIANGSLKKIWDKYIKLEKGIVSASWLADGWLDVRVEPAEAERQSLLEAAWSTFPVHEPNVAVDPRLEQAVRTRLEQLMGFGQRAEHLRVMVGDASTRVRGEDGSIEEQAIATIYVPAYARLWYRMLPTRPAAPK